MTQQQSHRQGNSKQLIFHRTLPSFRIASRGLLSCDDTVNEWPNLIVYYNLTAMAEEV
jgi:hypothetical protein